jgi:hypothetical protein
MWTVGAGKTTESPLSTNRRAEISMTTTEQQQSVHPAFDAAERVAPEPTDRDTATVDQWVLHYCALALAAHTAFRDALRSLSPTPEGGSRPDLGYLVTVAVSATAAAIALTTPPAEVAGVLWDYTPEAGALNGEYLDWLDETLDRLGINPADIDHHLDTADFRSPSNAASHG